MENTADQSATGCLLEVQLDGLRSTCASDCPASDLVLVFKCRDDTRFDDIRLVV